MDLETAILVYLAMAVFAYAIIYEIFHRHWISGIAALAAVVIEAYELYTEDFPLGIPLFMILLALTFIIFFIRLFRNKG
jgi:ATP/ADP translocase